MNRRRYPTLNHAHAKTLMSEPFLTYETMGEDARRVNNIVKEYLDQALGPMTDRDARGYMRSRIMEGLVRMNLRMYSSPDMELWLMVVCSIVEGLVKAYVSAAAANLLVRDEVQDAF